MNKLTQLNLELLRIVLKGFDPEVREYILEAVKYYEAAPALTPNPSTVTELGPWLIWSNEHESFWRPNHRGYTYHASAAGRYSFEEAFKICNGANFPSDEFGYPTDPENQRTTSGRHLPLHEVMCPSPELIQKLRSAAKALNPSASTVTEELAAELNDLVEAVKSCAENKTIVNGAGKDGVGYLLRIISEYKALKALNPAAPGGKQ